MLLLQQTLEIFDTKTENAMGLGMNQGYMSFQKIYRQFLL